VTRGIATQHAIAKLHYGWSYRLRQRLHTAPLLQWQHPSMEIEHFKHLLKLPPCPPCNTVSMLLFLCIRQGLTCARLQHSLPTVLVRCPTSAGACALPHNSLRNENAITTNPEAFPVLPQLMHSACLPCLRAAHFCIDNSLGKDSESLTTPKAVPLHRPSCPASYHTSQPATPTSGCSPCLCAAPLLQWACILSLLTPHQPPRAADQWRPCRLGGGVLLL
jgi:hypothetical protein